MYTTDEKELYFYTILEERGVHELKGENENSIHQFFSNIKIANTSYHHWLFAIDTFNKTSKFDISIIQSMQDKFNIPTGQQAIDYLESILYTIMRYKEYTKI